MSNLSFDCRTLIPALALLAAAPLATSAPASAAAADGAAEDTGPGAGTLIFRGLKQADTMPAVRLGTDMNVTVTGSIARVRVTQAFRNTSDTWMEATYLYPLSEDGAVDSLKMVVGQRVILGRIEKRDAARAIYEKAKASGQKAGLVEQQRPNMFTTNVANVGPGETVLISIEYQAPVTLANGTYALRLPLVVGPCYTPPHALTSAAAITDAYAVTSAPVMNPKAGLTLNPTSITVHLQPGFETANLISPYHRIAVTGRGDDRTITLAAGAVPADRDFELDWRSAPANPSLGLFREKTAGGDYVMATITPPADLSNVPAPPREMVFVIDNSGSMGGASMDEAKASLIHALATLRPQDHFNIIRFDDTMTQLFDHSVAATPDQVALATRFARKLEANGGTEMLPALRAALKDAAASGGPAALRQIIFLTDGEVSNEQEMMAALGQDGGRSHVFFVGIGSAPNDHLMSRMATIGRGAYTHVGTSEEVAAKMMPLLDILGHPAMQNLAVKVAGGTLDLTPKTLPDIYAGQPLVLVGRTDRLSGTITVSGTIGTRPWAQTVDLAKAADSPAVAKLWARRRIDDIEADRALGKMADKAADDAVADIGLNSGLVTSQTSLVAIDATPSRPAGAGLSREDLPINLPAGWDFDTLFGRETGKAAMLDAEAAQTAGQTAALDLPQTATGFVGTVLQGLVLLLTGLIGLLLLRPRPLVMGGHILPVRRDGARGFAKLLLVALCLAGLARVAIGAIVPIKAIAAQILLERAFDRSLAFHSPQKPWPWADMAPIARIHFPRLGIDRIVLDTGSGQAMAFGPALLPGAARIGAPGTTVIAAHRDTHFRFLHYLRPGDVIEVETLDGINRRYRITNASVMRWNQFAVPSSSGENQLALSTCYPFDAIRHGPLRFVVWAVPIEAQHPGERIPN